MAVYGQLAQPRLLARAALTDVYNVYNTIIFISVTTSVTTSFSLLEADDILTRIIEKKTCFHKKVYIMMSLVIKYITAPELH